MSVPTTETDRSDLNSSLFICNAAGVTTQEYLNQKSLVRLLTGEDDQSVGTVIGNVLATRLSERFKLNQHYSRAYRFELERISAEDVLTDMKPSWH
jgi:hypothetical protein